MATTKPVKKQKNPDYSHDASEHKFTPDGDGVCKKCGWWDPSEVAAEVTIIFIS